MAEAHRQEWASVLAATVRLTRDVDLAEDAVQEAYVRALRAWSERGIPRSPGAWLTTTARRIAMNALTRDANLRSKLPLLLDRREERADPEDEHAVPDDRLRLVFTCCHPALSESAKVALTLRLICGMSTPDVARVLLASPSAMAARITRAKKKIQAARIPYAVPTADELPARTHAVVTVLYLMYTAGHTAPSGADLAHADVAERAIDLARTLRRLMPQSGQVAAVLALMLLSQARTEARRDDSGRLVRLADQDRSRWDRALIGEGLEHLAAARSSADGSRFTIEAAITALHTTARRHEDTDWRSITKLYDALLALHPSPVVALNRAIAISRSNGVAAAHELVEQLVADGRLDNYVYLHATRAELNKRLGRPCDALAAYRKALELTDNTVEQQFLRARADEVEAQLGGAT